MSDSPGSAPQFVVGVGASAGGLKAFRDFFAAVPPDVDMAFVVLQHLAPDYPSELADILQGATRLTVREVHESPPVERGCVYVIPPGKLLSAVDGFLTLRDPTRMERRSLIDHFFRTLAEAQGEKSVAIVLSGMGSDGLSGLQRVKEVGGFTMVQAPGEAQFDSMPRSALASGMVDFCAGAAELAERLVSLPKQLEEIPLEPADGDETREAEALSRLFVQLRSRTGYDFSDYKRSTIGRRLRRRMQVLRVDTVADYLDLLRADADEAHVLVKDFLISVTNFFRDPEAFEALLEASHLPRIVAHTPPGRPIRVWVPGCATGEEAYSLAILLCELTDALPSPPPIQIFASDIDDDALAVAREALYPTSIAGDLTAERLARFFREESGGYRVAPEVTEKVLFAHHDLLEDPPFSRLDLISCRNVLIYFNRTPQEQAFDTFHYALRDSGLLLLGSSESAKTFGKLFQVSDAEHRIFARNASAARVPRLNPRLLDVETERLPRRRPRASAPTQAAGELHRRLLVALTAPPSVLVTKEYEVRHYEGEIGRVLRPASGDPGHHLLQMAPPEIRAELQSALFQAFRDDGEAHADATLEDGTHLRITVRTVTPPGGDEQLALVLFADRNLEGAAPPAPPIPPDEQQRSLVESLQADVASLRQRLYSTVEEYEISGEELRASNEELQSINEETRSLAEELETSKEELQSTNEELATVNAELQVKVDELSRSKSDLENLMHATDIGTVFLDRSLALKRYTPRVTDLFYIIPTDIGRPFEHVSHRLSYDGLAADAAAVLDRLSPVRREVQTGDGRWFLVHVLPYRTTEDRIDGVVLTFVDITDRKSHETEQQRRAQQQTLAAELGSFALRSESLQNVLDLAARVVARALDVPLASVLRYDPDAHRFALRARVGWPEGSLGAASAACGMDSHAGFTLTSDAPVLVSDVASDRRFEGSDEMAEMGVVSGACVAVRDPEGAAWGVIGAHTRASRTFADLDAAFLQSVANVVGAAVGRYRSEDALRHATQRFRTAIAGSPVSVFSQDLGGRYTWVYNPAHHTEAEILGRTDAELLARPDDARRMDAMRQAVIEQDRAERLEMEVEVDGALRHYLLHTEPTHDREGRVVGTTSAALDITDAKRTEAELRELTHELEDRVELRTAEVTNQSNQMRKLASELTLAEQRERHHLAQVLHDDLQQLLYSLQLKLSFFARADSDPAKIAQLVERFDGLLARAIDTTRTLSVDLSPPVLAGEGITQAIEWLSVQMQQLHGLTVRVSGDAPPLGSHDLQVLLFQLVRELLFNIVKHAGVDTASVRIDHDANQLVIEVRDDGVGFSPDALEAKQARGGFGLYSVRERLPLFDGRLEIVSHPGEGTRAVITLPLPT